MITTLSSETMVIKLGRRSFVTAARLWDVMKVVWGSEGPCSISGRSLLYDET
jgi:hypothetical protein